MVGARYVFGETFEVSIQDFGYQFHDYMDGLKNPVLGARLQLGEKTLLFLDFGLPIGTIDNDPGYLKFGLQQAFVLNSHFAWSSEIGFQNLFTTTIDDDYYYGSYDYDHGSLIEVATEMDIHISRLILFAGYAFAIQITDGEADFGDFTDSDGYAGSTRHRIFFGPNLKITENINAEVEYSMQFGSKAYDYSADALAFYVKFKF